MIDNSPFLFVIIKFDVKAMPDLPYCVEPFLAYRCLVRQTHVYRTPGNRRSSTPRQFRLRNYFSFFFHQNVLRDVEEAI